VSGSVVISVDYFKRFLAGLRQFVGGRVKSYETILDRARREAVLRLKEEAAAAGYAAVINVRLETARMANGRNGSGIAGLEVLAYGTGIKLRHGAP
ncbi:MAG: heavy metal-binding domain-containing protein, partial [Deltaproteobacteria bacterium]|nr:heavy metal-binding domain-containing protein [Deltaproteobacteria bacterium]